MCDVVVILDPGHGGSSPGAKNEKSHILEKTINLDVALKVQKLTNVKYPKIEYILTRNTSMQDRSLEDRVLIAEVLGAPLISIHCNSFVHDTANGSEIWCFAKTQKNSDDESEDYKLAKAINERLAALNLFKDRGIKSVFKHGKNGEAGEWIVPEEQRYFLLKKIPQPVLIVELGFISNENDLENLITKQDLIAKAIHTGICDYYS